MEEDLCHRAAKIECQNAAELLRVTSITRIDIRTKGENGGKFFQIEVNPKPNVTGTSRSGRDDQDSLWVMAVRGFGWEYASFVRKCIATTYPLEDARTIWPPEAVVWGLDNFTAWGKWKGKGKVAPLRTAISR
ncbi:hypothetical protein HOY80DRAFT_1035138 [Tuber brumale]|nr:hypothetical protein HOY80DRAFT_1035138 [Tuber brumale]